MRKANDSTCSGSDFPLFSATCVRAQQEHALCLASLYSSLSNCLLMENKSTVQSFGLISASVTG